MAATYTSVVDALSDNADFEEVGSVTKAKAFITAANRFFILVPEETRDHEGHSARMSIPAIQELLQRARSFVATQDVNNTGSRVLHPGDGFRG